MLNGACSNTVHGWNSQRAAPFGCLGTRWPRYASTHNRHTQLDQVHFAAWMDSLQYRHSHFYNHSLFVLFSGPTINHYQVRIPQLIWLCRVIIEFPLCHSVKHVIVFNLVIPWSNADLTVTWRIRNGMVLLNCYVQSKVTTWRRQSLPKASKTTYLPSWKTLWLWPRIWKKRLSRRCIKLS